MRPDELFALLGDPTRLAIVEVLAQNRHGLSIGEIARALGASHSSVSQHVKLLREGGLLASHRDGRRVVCRLDAESRRRMGDLARGLPGIARRKEAMLSARNRLLGTVTAIERDEVTSAVTLDVNGQTMRSVITTEALDELAVEVGDAAYAVVKATEVMLMR